MKLMPYTRVDDTPFTVTRDTVLASRGPPLQRMRNAVALEELDYGDVIFRFQDNGRLEEVTKRAPILFVGTDAVLFPALAAYVRTHDAGWFERGGFVISPAFGFAFAPECPTWVTALARHCIETWRAL